MRKTTCFVAQHIHKAYFLLICQIDSSKIERPYDECEEAYMPPNGDGVTDSIFFPQKGQVTIFDKKGKIIKTMNIPAEWDGTQTNGRVPQGYYTAEINQGEELINISVMY